VSGDEQHSESGFRFEDNAVSRRPGLDRRPVPPYLRGALKLVHRAPLRWIPAFLVPQFPYTLQQSAKK
jgi:hypothetical protein